MSPELVMLPAARVAEINSYARDLGVQRIVRVMETLGTTMVDMRHAPDARLLLEVAVVQLSSPVFDDSNENLLARISQLEEAVKQLKENGVAAALPPPPLNPNTGRAKIGGRAASPTQETPRDPSSSTPRVEQPTAETPVPVVEKVEAPAETPSTDGADPAQAWPQITDSLKGLAKALFKPAVVESFDGKTIVVRMPANTPLQRAREREAELVAAIKKVCNVSCTVQFNQADATAGTERPVIEDKPEAPETIDKIVEKDPFAPIDLSETVAANEAPDALMEALQSTFPQGSIVDDDTAPTEL